MLFFRDLKIAVRSLARVPALWITVALTLALGIGANAAIFSVVRAVLLRPLANRDEDKLLYLRQSAPGIGQDNATFSVPEIQNIGSGLKSIKELGTFSEVDFTIVGLGTPREIPAGVVDGHYFEVMGLRPELGRLLTPADDGQSAAGAVVLTYHFWKTSLHSDPSVIGKTVRLEGPTGARSATVVGVLEPAVPYPVATEIIANIVTSPHHLSATMVTGREHRMTEVFARWPPAQVSTVRVRSCAAYTAHGGGTPGGLQAGGPFQDRRNAHARADQFARQYNSVDTVRSFGPTLRDCELERCQSGAGANGASRTGVCDTLGAGRKHCSAAPFSVG
jgi:putative ABC transport system permease protein